VPAVSPSASPRVLDNFTRRFNTAKRQALVPPPAHPVNGDLGLSDQCGTYTKALKQASPGKVDLAAFAKFQAAIASGQFADFELVPLGGTAKLNGPMGSYAWEFLGAENSLFTTAAPPSMKDEWYATELIELYWCSLLRDVAFADYATDAVAHRAAKELSGLPFYYGPTDAGGVVTPELLFRGNFAGEREGPYVSQFLIAPTVFGALPFDQRYITYRAGVDYMTDQASWYAVQQGIATGFVNQKETVPRYLHNGRGLAAWTHVDELYQAYFTAYLAMNALGVPANPGSPYMGSATQKPFGTFGGPDIAAVLGQVAKYALNAVWYQKWVVHLRHRPEAGAGLVHLIKHGHTFDATPHASVFHSHALAESHAKYGTYLLSQPFPEGSPTHPAYPTGHGTVGGACITVLKFFYNGAAVLTNPQMPNYDGTSLTPWTGQPGTGDAGPLTVNGELAKLAHNITFGHGLHGGIHWRSDSDASMLLGEAAAISFLQDLACSYAEPVDVTITKLDGTTVTIKNM
jgi:hypothetical protein